MEGVFGAVGANATGYDVAVVGVRFGLTRFAEELDVEGWGWVAVAFDCHGIFLSTNSFNAFHESRSR